MIDLSQLPVDITEHINKFRNFLDISGWHIYHVIMEKHDWHDDGDFDSDWLQVNWEMLVGRELLGKNYTLSSFSVFYGSNSILHKGRDPDFVVICKVKKDQINAINKRPIPENCILRLYSFNTFEPQAPCFSFSPPFDFACLVDIKTNELFTIPFSDGRYFLYAADSFKDKQ